MPNETPEPSEVPPAINPETATPDLSPKPTGEAPVVMGPPSKLQLAVEAFEEAVRQWWKDQDNEAAPAQVATAITTLLLERQEPYLDMVPMNVRSHFVRFQREHPVVVREAIHAAVKVLIPATAQ